MNGRRRALAAGALLAGAAGCAAPAPPHPGSEVRGHCPGPVVGAVDLVELFGVRHPDQVLEVQVAEPVAARLACVSGPDGGAVPFQVVAGRPAVLLRTDLPAGGRRTFSLHDGPPATGLEAELRVLTRRDHVELSGARAGVRLARMTGDLAAPPVPIQGVRLADGAWTARPVGALADGMGRPRPAVEAGLRVLERGPLRAVAEVAYRFADGGSHRTRVEVQAGQPSVLVEEESTGAVSYALDTGPGLGPDRARYRGHHASSARTGREPDGRAYRPLHEREPLDALLDLADLGDAGGAAPHRLPLAVWDPWVVDGGWYWLLFRAEGPPAAPVLGLFAGRASRALGAGGSGVALRVDAGTGRAPRVLLEYRARPRATGEPRVRVAWGLYAGTRGADLPPADRTPPVARQMNLHAGIGLAQLVAWRPEAARPLDPEPGVFVPTATLARLRERLRDDPALAGDLATRDSTAREILAAWRDDTDLSRRALVDRVDDLARRLLAALVEGDGIYAAPFQYWLGGLEMVRAAGVMAALLADPRTTPADRARLARVAALFEAVLWDEDFVPLDPGHGLHLGTENMPAQQRAYRAAYAALRAGPGAPPAGRLAAAADSLRAVLRDTVAEDGAHMSATHYIGASLGPWLAAFQALSLRGVDLPGDEPRLARLAEFSLGLLTPPEPRFGGRRKVVAIGDSATEAPALAGLLAAGLARAAPGLSRRLMGAWLDAGAPHDGFHGSTVFRIDPGLPASAPAPRAVSYPGYYSSLRTLVGTPEETAVWLLHGDVYRDHYHDDQGSVIVYALGAPVSLDWGSLYTPRVSGAYMHSTAQLPDRLPFAWDQDQAPLDGGHRWEHGAREAFQAAGPLGVAVARFRSGDVEWRRALYLAEPAPGAPVVVLRDRFRRPGAAGPVGAVVSLNLAADGPVGTPAGPVAPGTRAAGSGEGEPGSRASASSPFPLPAGASRLVFRGQWGVDWDLWVALPAAGQALLGHFGHRSAPAREQAEFAAATGRPFEERQHILRILASDEVDLVLVPYRTGEPPPIDHVERAAGGLRLSGPAGRLHLDDTTLSLTPPTPPAR